MWMHNCGSGGMRMSKAWIRTQMLIGEDALMRLEKASVVIFGVGGVGGYAAEALARTGIGRIVLIDHDVVSESNRNRQLIALTDTVGRPKVDVWKERIAKINPDCEVITHQVFVLDHNIEELLAQEPDYLVDALDTVTAKIAIAEAGYQRNIPVISAMGTGNKLDPGAFRMADIYETSICPLCRVMRRELRKRGLPGLKVVYSTEEPLTPDSSFLTEKEAGRKPVPGSMPFVPGAAGLMMAAEVCKDLIRQRGASR